MSVFERFLTIWVGLAILAGVRLCRPSESVLDLLDRLPPGPFFKEDGQLLIDETGKRHV
jgi:hypothetical protein